MVRKATWAEQQAWQVLPVPGEITNRRLSSFLLMTLLFTSTKPFQPFCWLNFFAFLDYFISRILVIGALYFQYAIAGIVVPVKVELLDRRIVWVYRQKMYWVYAVLEVVVILGVRASGGEVLRKVVSVGLVGGLWILGWKAASWRAKRSFWGYVWCVWGCMLLFWNGSYECGK